MQNHEYIHIAEAVHKYNKTRQTFYNYIKKGKIALKKINNKVYLKVKDIEKIMSNYIPFDYKTDDIYANEEGNVYHEINENNESVQIIYPEYETYNAGNEISQSGIQENKTQHNVGQKHSPQNQEQQYHEDGKTYEHQKDNFQKIYNNLLQEHKNIAQKYINDTIFDIKAVIHNQQQNFLTQISTRYKSISYDIHHMQKNERNILLRHKKISFRLGYFIFLILIIATKIFTYLLFS